MSQMLSVPSDASVSLAQDQTDKRPVVAYLQSLSPGPSQRTAWQSLQRVANAMVPGASPWAIPWHMCRREHVLHVQASLVAKRLAPATINLALSSFKRVMEECWNLGLIGHEEFGRIKSVRGVRGSRLPAGRFLPQEDVKKLFGVAKTLRDKALLALLYGSGLRRAEVASLDVDHINWQDGTVRVIGKGNKERMVPLPDSTLRTVKAWCRLRGEASGALFYQLNNNGRARPERMTSDAIARRVKVLVAKAELEDVTVHDFRRTYASRLFDANIDAITVQKLLGHSSPVTTSRYDRRSAEAQKRAVKVLDFPSDD